MGCLSVGPLGRGSVFYGAPGMMAFLCMPLGLIVFYRIPGIAIDFLWGPCNGGSYLYAPGGASSL